MSKTVVLSKPLESERNACCGASWRQSHQAPGSSPSEGFTYCCFLAVVICSLCHGTPVRWASHFHHVTYCMQHCFHLTVSVIEALGRRGHCWQAPSMMLIKKSNLNAVGKCQFSWCRSYFKPSYNSFLIHLTKLDKRKTASETTKLPSEQKHGPYHH